MSDEDLEHAAYHLDLAADAINDLHLGDLPEHKLNSLCDLRAGMRERALYLRSRTESEDE